MKMNSKILAAVASTGLFALSSQAAQLALTSDSAFPTTAQGPLILNGPGPFSLNLYAAAQGTGFVQNLAAGIFVGSTPVWAGGQISATNVFPAATGVTGTAGTTAPASQFAFSQTAVTVNGAAIAGYASTIPFNTIGGVNTGTPTGPITSAQLISTLTGTISAPGTYYFYIGRTGGGITESVVQKEAVFIGGLGTGASVSQTSRFGYGDTAVATGGAGANGSGANTLSTAYDFQIIVVPEPTSLSMLGLGALGLMSRRRKA